MEQNMNFEWVKKVREAKTSAELMELAKENGIDLTEDEAAKLFDTLSQGAQGAHDGAEQMSEKDLAKVSGGWALDKTLNLLDDEVFHQQLDAILSEMRGLRGLGYEAVMCNVDRLQNEKSRQFYKRWYGAQ